MFEEIRKFINDDDPEVVRHAAVIQGIWHSFDTDEIDEEMKDELLADVVELIKAEGYAKSLQNKIRAQEMLDLIKMLVSVKGL